MLAFLCDAEGESLLVIHEHGVFPSAEDRFLFDGFRRSLGERAPVHEKPGHLFTRDDAKAVASLLALVLYFAWGAYIFPESGRFVVQISHDEILDVWGDEATLGTFRERLNSFLGTDALVNPEGDPASKG